jgi:tetratricopeptide (TPR) repeat protein
MYKLNGNYAAALADFDRAIELDNQHASSFVGRGQTYQFMGNYAAAMADFDHAIELAPNNDRLIYYRALLSRLLNREESAQRNL